MGALVNVFKSIFGGILGFLGGLFAGKKGASAALKPSKPKKGKDGFYMEAPEIQVDALPVAAIEVEAPAAGKADKKEKVAKGKKGAVQAVVATAPAKPAAPKSTDELIAAALAAVAKPPAGSPEAAATQPVSLGFAQKNMIPTLTTGRRRPGPSLSPFKAMAKEIRA